MRTLAPLTRRRKRVVLLAFVLLIVALAVWYAAPHLEGARDALRAVRWPWVVAAVGMNLLSVGLRAAAWRVVVARALPEAGLSSRAVFSAFGIGVLANAVLPGRVGELARLAVLSGRLEAGLGAWATVGGSIFAHHLLDVVPLGGLVAYVLYSARVPRWAIPAIALTIGGGTALLVATVLRARHPRRKPLATEAALRRLLARLEEGLGVFRSPAPATGAVFLQSLGWTAEFFGAYFAFSAFRIEAPFAAAGAVLMLTNVATLLPLWPGNVGLFQAGVALPLLAYGVPYLRGLAYGAGLQAIELVVALGVGLPLLAYQGLSFAGLREALRSARAEGGGRAPRRRLRPRRLARRAGRED